MQFCTGKFNEIISKFLDLEEKEGNRRIGVKPLSDNEKRHY